MNNNNIYYTGNNSYSKQKNLDDIYNYFYNSYDPYYSSLKKTDVANLGNTINPNLSTYNTNLADLRQNEISDTRDFNQGEAQRGVFNSTGKMLREKSLNTKYNKLYNSSYQTTKQAIQNALINYGSKYGSENTPTFDLQGGGLNYKMPTETLSGANGGQINAMDAERRKQAKIDAGMSEVNYGQNPIRPYNI